MFDVFYLKNNFILMIIVGYGVKYCMWSILNMGGVWLFLVLVNISWECFIMEVFRILIVDILIKIDIIGVR